MSRSAGQGQGAGRDLSALLQHAVVGTVIARRDGVEDVVHLRVGLRRIEVVQLLQLLLLQLRPALLVLELCPALTDGINNEGKVNKQNLYTPKK